jgi:hypothetical protein
MASITYVSVHPDEEEANEWLPRLLLLKLLLLLRELVL